jgi:hypothetical protein
MDIIQEKVNMLISLVENFMEKKDFPEKNQLSQKLVKAIFCLKSHDLIGIDIIKTSIEKNEHFQNTTDEYIVNIKNQVFELIDEIKQDFKKDEMPISIAEELFLNLSYNKFLTFFLRSTQRNFGKKNQIIDSVEFHKYSQFTMRH